MQYGWVQPESSYTHDMLDFELVSDHCLFKNVYYCKHFLQAPHSPVRPSMESHDSPLKNPCFRRCNKNYKQRGTNKCSMLPAAEENKFYYHRPWLHSFNFLEAVSTKSHRLGKGVLLSRDQQITKYTGNRAQRYLWTWDAINHSVLIV